MSRTTMQPKEFTLNLRLEPELKSDFMAVAQAEARPAAEVLRGLMREYVQEARRKDFLADAERQCRLLAQSPEAQAEEIEAMRWLDAMRAPLPEEPDEDWFITSSER